MNNSDVGNNGSLCESTFSEISTPLEDIDMQSNSTRSSDCEVFSLTSENVEYVTL